MKVKNTKALIFCAVLSLCAIIISIALIGCSEEDPSDTLDIPKFDLTISNQTIFDSTAAANTVFQGLSGEVVLNNSSNTKIELTLHYKNTLGEQASASLTAEGGKSSSKAPIAGDLLAIDLSYEQGEDDQKTTIKCGYAFYDEGIVILDKICDFTFISVDLTAKDLVLTRPTSIIIDNATLTADSIYLKSDLSGSFIIEEKGTGHLECPLFYADALSCRVKIPKIKKVNNNPSYYLRVESYNSKTVDHLDIKVDDLKDFEKLIAKDSLPTLYSNTKITLSSFELSESIAFDMPISLHFASDMKVNKEITVNTESKCTLNYSAERGATLPSFPVIVTAPNADVTWDIPRSDGVTLFDIASKLDVATLNGKHPASYALGGDGSSKITSIILDKNSNKNITQSIKWTLEDYVFKATVNCVVDINTLKDAILEVTASSGGKVSFDTSVTTENGGINLLANSGCYCTVTDSSGKSLRYLIETEYVPSKIPVVVIDTQNGAAIESNEEYISASVYMNCDEITGFTSLSTQSATIRGRGHSTWKWDKKPYKIKFDSKTSLFGLEAAKDWVLLANYTDKSLIRNFVAMEGARVLDNLTFVGHQYPVDLFLNGEYLGVYTMGEQMEAKKGRIELTDNGTAADTGFLLEIGGTSSEDVWNETCFYTTLCKYVKVKSPNEETLTKEQVAYIRDYVKKADEAVMAGEGYEEYIDVDSLIDWVIVHELYYNIDSCFRRSCYFTKEPGGKLKMGPIWDFDNAFGNFWKDDKTYSTWATADSTSSYIWDNWMSYLINDPEFRMKFKARWDEIKYPLLNKVVDSINNGADLIDRSAEFNFQKWDILNKRVGCEDSSIVKYNTFDKQISYFRDFVNKRWKWLDENI